MAIKRDPKCAKCKSDIRVLVSGRGALKIDRKGGKSKYGLLLCKVCFAHREELDW